MKKEYFTYANVALAAILIFLSGLGGAIVDFVVGLVLGLVLTGLFMFFYNIAKPGNKIKLGIPERITAGLLCGILWNLITRGIK